MAAAAGVHGGDELHAGRIADMGGGAGDRDGACFERLAERIEDSALELGKLVEEQHAEMGEADFAGPRFGAAADKGGHRGAVVGRAEGTGAEQAPALQPAGHGGDHRDFERFGRREFRQDAGEAGGEQ